MAIRYSKTGASDTVVSAIGFTWGVGKGERVEVVSIRQEGVNIEFQVKELPSLIAALNRAAAEAEKRADRDAAKFTQEDK